MKLTELKNVNEELQPVDLETIYNVREKINLLGIPNAVIRKITKTGTEPIVDVRGDVILNDSEHTKLPFQFGIVTGDFTITNFSELMSLEGFPKKIGKSLDITRCNKLKSLKGITQDIGFSIYMVGLEGIESLEGLPEIIKGSLYINIFRNLKSLKGISKEINGDIFISQNPKLRGHLQLFEVKGIKRIDLGNEKVNKIFNKYYPKKDMLNCQDELIEAGFEEYAEVE